MSITNPAAVAGAQGDAGVSLEKDLDKEKQWYATCTCLQQEKQVRAGLEGHAIEGCAADATAPGSGR